VITAAELRLSAAHGDALNPPGVVEAADTIELLERKVAWWRQMYVDDVVPDDIEIAALDQACEEAAAPAA
jgi:hypothetical protein